MRVRQSFSDLYSGLTWKQIDTCRYPLPLDRGTFANIDHIERATNKSRGRRRAYIPIMPEARTLLDTIPCSTVTVLTTTKGKPWSGGSGLSQAITKAAKSANVPRNTHDLRRTFATRFALAGVQDREIAEVMGWAIESVAELRRVYVDRAAIMLSLTERFANNSSIGSSNSSN